MSLNDKDVAKTRSFNPPGLGSQEKPPGEGGFQPEP